MSKFLLLMNEAVRGIVARLARHLHKQSVVSLGVMHKDRHVIVDAILKRLVFKWECHCLRRAVLVFIE